MYRDQSSFTSERYPSLIVISFLEGRNLARTLSESTLKYAYLVFLDKSLQDVRTNHE